MHIPDGFLNATTCVGAYLLAGGGLALTSRQVSATWTERSVPLIGVMSAFVFAGQMVNFPVAGGTSGHLLGGMLAAALLGPWTAAMVMATVLTVQCLFFQDGGITALGANVLNLALVGVLGGNLVYRGVERLGGGGRARVPALALGAWFSVVVASAACALELALSGTAPLRLVLPAMVLTHAVIGVGEALITIAVASFIARVRPDLLFQRGATPLRTPAGLLAGVGLAAALGVALLLTPLASSLPDGLERIAEKFGFAGRAETAIPAPFAEYSLPGIDSRVASTVIAAALGTVLCFGLAWIAARIVARRIRSAPDSEG